MTGISDMLRNFSLCPCKTEQLQIDDLSTSSSESITTSRIFILKFVI